MTKQVAPNCIFCGSPQSVYTKEFKGIFSARLFCDNGGCSAHGPVRESVKREDAISLAIESYTRALKTSSRLDLDRRSGVGHNPRDPGGKRPRGA